MDRVDEMDEESEMPLAEKIGARRQEAPPSSMESMGSIQSMTGSRAARLLAAFLVLATLGCNEPAPGPDAGTAAGVDSGDPAPAPDAAAPGPDAGLACPAGRSACGLNCCDDATETCSGGACFDRGCASSEIACGQDCCNRATQYCDATNTCQPSASCNSREVVCGSQCCDTLTSYCALAATSTCGTLAACKEQQLVCGAQCCDGLTQTCDFAVHACKGADPTECDPLAPTACVAAESCQATPTSWVCGAAGTALEGDACSSVNPCAAGMDCFGIFDRFCYRYCPVGDDLACGGGYCWDAFLDGRIGICLCDPLHQLGCSGDDACYSNDVATSCAPAGPGVVGAACQDDRDCARGLSCGFAGTCAAFCDARFPSGGCSPGRGGPACISFGDGTGFCGTRCAPLKQDCPEPGAACFASPETGGFCAPPGTVPDGERCSSPTSCAKGSNCMRTSANGDYRCLPACDATVRRCGAGGTCIALGTEGVGGCVSAACDPVAQVGCGSGTACYWDERELGYSCQPSGSGPSGAACVLDSDCVPGLTCIGKCVPYCRPQAPTNACTGTGATCRDYLGTGFGACVNDLCDPRAQDCPTATEACYPADTGYFCAAPGKVADGLTCTAVTDCRKGSTCLGSSQSKQCYRLCDATASADLCAATSQTCIAISGPLGVCY